MEIVEIVIQNNAIALPST